jgi:hypothetical protein
MALGADSFHTFDDRQKKLAKARGVFAGRFPLIVIPSEVAESRDLREAIRWRGAEAPSERSERIARDLRDAIFRRARRSAPLSF